jgi:hypothetical protein
MALANLTSALRLYGASLLPSQAATHHVQRTMKTEETTRLSHAEQNAEGWSDEITAAWEAYHFCQEQGDGRYLSTEAKAMLKEHGYDGTNHDTVADAIHNAMLEAPLEISRPSEDPDDDETYGFCILLSTGGPALRIVGELNQWQEPARCWLEIQDWGTPWTRHFSRSAERATAIRWFASLFHYGQG